MIKVLPEGIAYKLIMNFIHPKMLTPHKVNKNTTRIHINCMHKWICLFFTSSKQVTPKKVRSQFFHYRSSKYKAGKHKGVKRKPNDVKYANGIFCAAAE